MTTPVLTSEARPIMSALHRTTCFLAPLAAVLLASSGCRDDAGRNESADLAPRDVVVAPAVRRDVERTITVFGSFFAQEQATLSTKVPGRLREIRVDIGSPVEAGEVIARVEPRDYEMRVRQADAALAQALARLGLGPEEEESDIEPGNTGIVRQARAVLDEARTNAERVERLNREGVLSQAELESAEVALAVAENRHQDAVEEVRQRIAMVAQRRIERDIAAQQLADSTIVAPFNAAVQDRRASPGEFLAAGDPVVTLIQMNPLRLRLEVAERDAALIHAGQPVRARVEGLPAEHTGPLVRVSPGIDPRRRVLIVEADVPNDGTLHPGMFARAEVVVNAAEPAVTVPTNSIVTFAGIEKVFTIVEGRSRERVVVTGRSGGDWVEIVTNLTAGESVILNPGNLRNDQPVKEAAGSVPAAKNPSVDTVSSSS